MSSLPVSPPYAHANTPPSAARRRPSSVHMGMSTQFELVCLRGVLSRLQWFALRQLRPGPHRPRFLDRGAEGGQEGSQGVTAEEALSGSEVERNGCRKRGLWCSCALWAVSWFRPASLGIHEIKAISASYSRSIWDV